MGLSGWRDPEFHYTVIGVIGLLVVASVIGWLLHSRARTETRRITIQNYIDRTNSWWIMVVIFIAAVTVGRVGTIVLFCIVSLLALREFLTLTPTKSSDHPSMLWIFFIITPFQYYLLAIDWYGMFTIMIPVYAFLFIPTLNALVRDPDRFLIRTATVHWGLMICVYSLSHAPAILDLRFVGEPHEGPKLLLWLVLIVQMSDFLQYFYGKLFGRHKIVPALSPNKTWEGFVGGLGTAIALGVALRMLTPFNAWQAALMALLATLLGFAGGLVFSSIKRDRGVKDFGTIVSGHGGILDRVDSLILSAPVIYHFSGFFF